MGLKGRPCAGLSNDICNFSQIFLNLLVLPVLCVMLTQSIVSLPELFLRGGDRVGGRGGAEVGQRGAEVG